MPLEESIPRRPDHGLPGVQGDPQGCLIRDTWGHALPHVESRTAGTDGVILLGERRAEHGGDAVAACLADGPPSRAHGRHHRVQRWIEIPHQQFGVRIVLGGKNEVRDQHRDLLPLDRDHRRGFGLDNRWHRRGISRGLVDQRLDGGAPLRSSRAPGGGKGTGQRRARVGQQLDPAVMVLLGLVAPVKREQQAYQGRPGGLVMRLEIHQSACMLERLGRLLGQTLEQRTQQRRRLPPRFFAFGGEPCLEGKAPRQVEPLEQDAAYGLGPLNKGWQRDRVQPLLEQLPQRQEINGGIVGGKSDGVAIGDDPAPSRLVDEAAQLGENSSATHPGDHRARPTTARTAARVDGPGG